MQGWSQQMVAEKVGTDAKRIGEWERGESLPSPYFRTKLRELFEKDAAELGFIELPSISESHPASVMPPVPAAHPPTPLASAPWMPVDKESYPMASSPQDILLRGETLASHHEVPVVLIHTHQAQAIDLLMNASDVAPEQQLGALLALEANDLVAFFDEGWSVNEVLEVLRVVLPVVQVQAMAKITRRTFGRTLLQLGAAAFVSGIPIPSGRHLSEEARIKLHYALGESIAAGWKLFHTASNAQVLAVGHAQLYLVQQNHALLPPRLRAGFYSSVYNLIGKAQHFRGRYQEALDAHMNGHIAAMSTGDTQYMTQSLICQADSYQALGQHGEAIEAIEEALRIIGNPTDEEHIRIKAHLLACWADNAMVMEEYAMAQTKLEESAVFLDQISPNEEFDRTSWLQLAGKCALATRDHERAIRYYTDALAELPPNWLIRQAFTLVPLMVAYACIREKNISLDIAGKATSIISSLNAPIINQQFAASVELGLLGAFPNDDSVRTFVAGLKHRLPALGVAVQSH